MSQLNGNLPIFLMLLKTVAGDSSVFDSNNVRTSMMLATVENAGVAFKGNNIYLK